MKILVNCLGYDSGKSGISAYMKNVLKHFKDLECEIAVLAESQSARDFAEFKTIKAPKIFSGGIGSYLFSIFASAFFARKFDCQLVLAGSRRFAPLGRTPAVGVAHDLSQYKIKGKYGALRMFQLKKIQPMLGRSFDRIAAISLSTKNDIKKYWHAPDEKIELNYNAPPEKSPPDFSVLKRLGLEKFILYVSRIEHPAKNHCALIEAFELLPQSIKKEHKLVFAGADWNGADAVKKRALASPEAKSIIFAGFVSGAELSALYESASAFAFPSLAEGFGLGLAEAMSCALPCACSNIPALAEVSAGSALLFDPKNPPDISKSLEKILSDKNLAGELSQKAKIRAGEFSWRAHAEKLLNMCEKADAPNRSIKIFGVGFRNGRLKETADLLISRAKRKIKTSVAFVNTHYLNCAYESESQRRRLSKFDFVLPDGSGISIACKILGKKYKENLNGTDLLPLMCEAAQREKLSMFFLGGREGVARRAAQNISKEYPELKIAGTHNGYFADSEKVLETINKAAPDILFVGLGAVYQEKWLLENFGRLECPLAMAVGGLCDVYSGDLKRSRTLRNLGLEWFGRLCQEPVRLFGRYVIGNPLFIARVLGYKFFGKCGRKNHGSGA